MVLTMPPFFPAGEFSLPWLEKRLFGVGISGLLMLVHYWGPFKFTPGQLISRQGTGD